VGTSNVVSKAKIALAMSRTRIGAADNPLKTRCVCRQPASNHEPMPANRSDWLCSGAVLAKLRPTNDSVPGYVQLPAP